uniref:Uncharacterized protein n=1 Tax=Arundo donax TaxID=35708 RepID=A0A0A9CP60_ARUDO
MNLQNNSLLLCSEKKKHSFSPHLLFLSPPFPCLCASVSIS